MYESIDVSRLQLHDSQKHLCELPPQVLDMITSIIDEDDALAMALTCRALCALVFERWPSRGDRPRLRSQIRGAVVSIARVSWAYHSCGLRLNEDTCAAAAFQGRRDVIEWLRSMECPWDEGTCAAAMEAGHVALFRWAKKEGCPYDALGWGRT